MRDCPICGEEDKWTYCHDYEHLEPDEGCCDFCGFNYQQYTASPHSDMREAMEDYVFNLISQIDNVNDAIKDLLVFKSKISELKRRVDFDGLRKEFGWEKTDEVDGCESWTKKSKNIVHRQISEKINDPH